MLRFINGIQVDATGASLPGAPQLSEGEVARLLAADAETQRLHQIAAGAERRLADEHNAGFGYRADDFTAWAAGRQLTTTQRMEAKRLVADLGWSIDRVARHLRV